MIKEDSSSSTKSLSTKQQSHHSGQGDAGESPITASKFYSPFYNFGAPSESTTAQQLLETLNKMSDFIIDIKALNNFIRLLYNTSAVETARSQKLIEEFAPLNDAVEQMVNHSDQEARFLESHIKNLLIAVLESLGVTRSEQSKDIIDKIDRNLFERNCDCQAWATFPRNINCLLTREEQAITESCDLLAHLCHIYEVYSDIFVCDTEGKIVAAGNNRHLQGTDCSMTEWFQGSIRGEVYVTDMYYCNLVNHHIVAYSAPVNDNNGKVIGVLSTRFNWDFVHEMLTSAKVEREYPVWVLSKTGKVIASRNGIGVLTDDLTWLNIGQIAMLGLDGFTNEALRNGQTTVLGGSRTQGYNNYAGKDWSVVIGQPLELRSSIHFGKTFSPTNNEGIEEHGNPAEVRLALSKPTLEKAVTEEPSQISLLSTPNDQDMKVDSLIHSDIANANLIKYAKHVQDSIGELNTINSDTLLISLNAAIKSSRAGEDGRGLSVVSDQIRKISIRSKHTTDDINLAVADLLQGVDALRVVKVKDAAWDAIDKVDRNLFERNCDVQAWTVFQEVIDCAKNKSDTHKAHALLNNLHRIYEIYDDIYLLNSSGEVLVAAIDENLKGKDFSHEAWFKGSVEGKVTVTDMFYAETTKNYTVAYSAPVVSDGQVVGVLTTRFNWNFIYDIIDKTIVPHGSQVYLLNNEGTLIASTDREGILERSFADSPAFQEALLGYIGVHVELDPTTEKPCAYVGYAQTKGYNKYSGKGWVVLISQSISQ